MWIIHLYIKLPSYVSALLDMEFALLDTYISFIEMIS